MASCVGMRALGRGAVAVAMVWLSPTASAQAPRLEKTADGGWRFGEGGEVAAPAQWPPVMFAASATGMSLREYRKSLSK